MDESARHCALPVAGIECLEGTFISDDGVDAANHQGAASCIDCPTGTYTSDVTGNSACTDCPLNFYQAALGTVASAADLHMFDGTRLAPDDESVACSITTATLPSSAGGTYYDYLGADLTVGDATDVCAWENADPQVQTGCLRCADESLL